MSREIGKTICGMWLRRVGGTERLAPSAERPDAINLARGRPLPGIDGKCLRLAPYGGEAERELGGSTLAKLLHHALHI